MVSIAATPANSSIAKGTAQQFTAIGTYSDSSTQNLTSSVTWNSTNTAAVTINASGLAAAVSPGTTTIQAISGSITGSTGLTVSSAVLTSIAVTPVNPSIYSGAMQQFTATGTFSDSSTQNITSLVTWSSSNTGVATVTTAGVATGMAAGTATIQASFASVTGSTGLTVTTTISGLVAWWKFDDGSGTTAVDSSGNGYNATLVNGVSWVAGQVGDAVSANGVNQYVGIPAINLSGTNAITWAAWVNRTYSTNGGDTLFENSTNFNSSTTGFGLFPDDGSDCPTSAPMLTGVHGNVGYTLSCYAQPSSGVWHHIAVVYDKSQAGSSVISLYIDGALQTPKENLDTATNTNAFGDNSFYLFSRGGASEYAAGEVDDLRLYNVALSAAQIQEIYQAGTASLVSIAVTPANPSIAKGATQQFTATGTYSDSSTRNLTSTASWSSTATGVATINSAGLATSAAVGGTTIQATSGSISGNTNLTVTPAVLVSISVTPANSSIGKGTTQQYVATGTYSDGSTQNLTSTVTWGSSSTAVATIAVGGLATGVGTGSTTIQATSSSITGSTGLTVTAVLQSIAVTPANPSISKGATQPFVATGTYNDGGTLNITSAVTWSSTNTTVATISSSGLASGVGAGSTTVQATSGSISGSTTLTVTTPTLVSIAVTPANATIELNGTEQYTATGTYSDNSTQNLTSGATWVSTNTAVATITTQGLASGIAAGETTIQATVGSITGSTGLTVATTLPGLVGWWKFDDGSGTTATDSSGNGYTATLFNGISWVPGRIGDAISANGTNQYASTPAIDLSATNAVTVTMWVNRTYNTTAGDALLEDSPNFNSSTTGFGLFPDDPTCKGILAGVHGNVGYSLNCYAQPSSGVWHHLAVVYDKSQTSGNVVKFYIDAVLQTPTQNYLTSTNTNNFGANQIYLFSRGGTQEFSAGMMDDLQLYDRALAASEIQTIYSSAPPPPPVTLTLNPTTVEGGGTSTATVTLGSAAPAGGATVMLSSSNTSAASVPPSVTVAANSTTATFTVTTYPITVAAAATITATYNGSGSANLNITPDTGQFVQFTSGDSGAATSSTTYQGAPATSGNLILVFSHWDNQTLTASVSDSLGNTYTSIAGPINVGTADRFQVWYAKNITGGTTLGIKVTYSGKTNSISLVDAGEYSGLDTAAPLDVSAVTTGSGTSQVSPSVTTTVNNETIVGLFGYSPYASPFMAGTGFTLRGYDASSFLEDMSVTQAGKYQANATSSSAANWAAFIVGLKAAHATSPTLVSLSVTPAGPSIPVGSTQQFAATGTFSDGSTQNLTS